MVSESGRGSGGLYGHIEPFNAIVELLDSSHYVPLPEDWHVFVADVRGSTAAIEAGRYRDVNTVGAACITALQHALGEPVPYVFGGDGASFAVPPEAYDRAAGALMGMVEVAASDFDLDLRAGTVPLTELRQAGRTVEVARHQLTPRCTIALFRGGGMTLAEELVKSDAGDYLCRAAAGDVVLEGLSCRWNPLPARRGVILACLVEAERDTTLNAVWKDLLDLLGGSIRDYCPAHPETLSYKPATRLIRDERRLVPRWASPSGLRRLLEITAAVATFRYGWNIARIPVERYRDAMCRQADFYKFDDVLRLVIDCSPQQARRIRNMLERRRRAGELYFGLHESQAALMTCLVESIESDDHIHFIDGAEGGYALAAVELKAQKTRTAHSDRDQED